MFAMMLAGRRRQGGAAPVAADPPEFDNLARNRSETIRLDLKSAEVAARVRA